MILWVDNQIVSAVGDKGQNVVNNVIVINFVAE